MSDADYKLAEAGGSAEDFLPQGYDVPAGVGNYMKFEIGGNKFRILASPVIGWEWWIDVDGGRKPVRVPKDGKVPVEFADSVKHFWAMPVWNYKESRVQILEITQKGIQRTIKALANDKEWGSPKGYDILVMRSGEGLDTEYNVIPSPPKPLPDEAVEAYKEMNINLEALYKGDDPFSKEVELTDEELDEVSKM